MLELFHVLIELVALVIQACQFAPVALIVLGLAACTLAELGAD